MRGDVRSARTKVVEAGAQVQSSIVWESGGTRTLFGREGVRGIANVDISPELAVRLAKAWASSFEKGSVITTSRDTSRAARVLKRALMVGCNSVGVNVTDLEVATIPVTRHHIRTRGTQGGLTVRLSPDDPQSVAIRFFDARGSLDLSRERTAAHRAALTTARGVPPGDRPASIGDIGFLAAGAWEHAYTADVVGRLFSLPERLPDRELKIVLDVSYGAASFVMPNLLSKVKADVLSINPYAQTPGMISGGPLASIAPPGWSDRCADPRRADLGAVIDAGGEHLTLVDGTGRVLSNDEALMVFLGRAWMTGRRRISAGGPAGHGQPEGLRVVPSPAGPRCSSTALSPSKLDGGRRLGGVVFCR